MSRKALQFAMALFGVSAAYFLYTLIAVPTIEGTVVKSETPRRVHTDEGPTQSLANRGFIKGLLPSDSWEHQNCKVLETQQGLVLFQDFEMGMDNQATVKPFTLIATGKRRLLDDSAEPAQLDGPPILLRSPEGAILKFASKGKSAGPDLGNLASGQLPGQVEITRQQTAVDAEDDLELHATNVQIDGTQIITPHDVEFRYGRSHGKGRNLRIELKPDENKPSTNLISVRGMKLLELAELHELVIETQVDADTVVTTDKSATGLTDVSEQTSFPGYELAATGDNAPNWARVNVNCQGAFRFDFEKSVATFFDRVHVVHLNADAENDTLDCQRLDLIFSHAFFPDKDEAVAGSPRRRPKIKSVVARGRPAVLQIGARHAVARGSYLEYDIASQKIVLKDERQVSLADPFHKITAPQLEYTLGEEGRVGVGWASGPGRIEKFAQADEAGFVVSWQAEMNVRPHEGKTAISLYEQARVVIGEGDSFDAGELHLWLWEIPRETNAVDRQPSKPRWQWLPAQLLATEGVDFNTAQVTGGTDELQVFWPNPSRENAGTNSTPPSFAEKKPGNAFSAGDRPNDQFASQPDSPQWKVSTDQAKVYLDRDNHCQLLELVGEVEIREQPTAESPENNLVVRGTNLTARPTENANLFQFNIAGNPAVITGRQQTIYGDKITLNQETNLIEVPGGGKMRLAELAETLGQTTPRFSGNPNRSSGNEPQLESSPTTIAWKEKLTFDGQAVKLFGDVNIQGERLNEAGERMKFAADAQQAGVTLDRRIDFRHQDKDQSRGKPQVLKLNLDDKVDIRGEVYDLDNQLSSIQHVAVDNIEFQYQTGEIECHSPGVIETTRLTKSGESEKRFAGEIIAKAADGLNYMQVNFAGGVGGNLYQRELTFYRKVRAIYGPVSAWAMKLDINEAQRNPQVMRLDCDQLSLGQWKADDQTATIEMVAEGNAAVLGSSFRSEAQRISFHQASDKIILLGDATSPARIWYQTVPNSSAQYAEANEIKYWHKRGQIAVDQLGKAEYSSDQPLQKPAEQREQSRGFNVPRLRGR